MDSSSGLKIIIIQIRKKIFLGRGGACPRLDSDGGVFHTCERTNSVDVGKRTGASPAPTFNHELHLMNFQRLLPATALQYRLHDVPPACHVLFCEAFLYVPAGLFF